MTLKDLFKEDSNYLELLSAISIEELEKKIVIDFPQGIAPEEKNFEPYWSVDKKHMIINFNEYQVADYAAGMPYVFITYEKLIDSIDPLGPLGSLLEPASDK